LSAFDIKEPLQRLVTPDDDNVAAQNVAAYSDSKQKNEKFDTVLIHQPTPKRLPGLDDESDTDSDEDNNEQHHRGNHSSDLDQNEDNAGTKNSQQSEQQQQQQQYDTNQEDLLKESTISNPVDLTNSPITFDITTNEVDNDMDDSPDEAEDSPPAEDKNPDANEITE